MLGKAKLFNSLEDFSSELEYRRFYSAYREALNSRNVFYQALSFYKVTEGVIAHRIRRKRATGIQSKGDSGFFATETFPQRVEDISSDEELSVGEFGAHLGRQFEDVHEHYREFVRNAVAHLSQLDSVLDADSYEDISTCEKAIPVLKYMARTVLQNDLGSIAKTAQNSA